MLSHFAQFEAYQVIVFALAVWLVVSLVPQLVVLGKHARDAADWEVVFFRGSLLLLGACVAMRYFFDLSPLIIVAGWLVLDISSTLNGIYIVKRSRASVNMPE